MLVKFEILPLFQAENIVINAAQTIKTPAKSGKSNQFRRKRNEAAKTSRDRRNAAELITA
jgi:hypothetical protein